jgi:hypothetical protein
MTMRRFDRFGTIAVLAFSTVWAPAFAGNVTVGQFYAELARAKRFVSVDASATEAHLRGAGFNLPRLALDKSLTEGDMTSISNAMGFDVTTRQPSRPVSQSLLDAFMSSFGGELGTDPGNSGLRNGNGNGNGNGKGKGHDGNGNGNGNGKGKAKGHDKSNSVPL